MISLNPGFQLRNVCGEIVVVAVGEQNIDFSYLIALNETSVFIWELLEEKAADSVDDIVEAILEAFEDVDSETAKADVIDVLATLEKYNIISRD